MTNFARCFLRSEDTEETARKNNDNKMKIIRKVSELLEHVAHLEENGRSVGLVPTMGALHDGHISLVSRAVAENDAVIVSLFVNPTQFNNPDDLRTYPRDEEADFRLLAREGVDAVFAPAVEEIYPADAPAPRNDFRLGRVAEVMEGAHRPGHFQGVAQIVYRLFQLVRPVRAYFGEKDFQQIAVIRSMVESEKLKVDIVACPIRRADDGLALSSRNALLTPAQRTIAPEIHKTLVESVAYSRDHSVDATKKTVVEHLDAQPEMKVEYFEIVDGRTLLPVEEWDEAPEVVGCITVFCGPVRLIDNIRYK